MLSPIKLFFLVCILCLSTAAYAQSADKPPAASVHLTQDQKEWLLATSAILTEMNHKRHDLLGEAEKTDKCIQDVRASVKLWWGIETREDFFKVLDWLEREGHRKEFDNFVANIEKPETQKFLDNYSAIEQKVMSQSDPQKLAELHEFKNRIDIVRASYKELGNKSIQAWDYARYVSLCRWGYVLGFMSEEEAWARIYPIGVMLQKTFTSWQDFGHDYFIGRRFWQYEYSVRDDGREKAVFKKLSEDASSPWQRYPWALSLKQSN